MTTLSEAQPQRALRRWTLESVPTWVRYTVGIYLLSRLLYLGVAAGDSLVQHWSLQAEMSNWDGMWYLATTTQGYPNYIPQGFHAYSTLGFLPLYPMLMWALSQLPFFSPFGAGLGISMLSGMLATLNMYRLSERWWDDQAARRAVLFFCLFPGTVVFSMDYSEGLGVLLVTISLLAMEDRRWVRAGLSAGCATAVAPVLLAIIPALLVGSLGELYRHGRSNYEARKSLLAPLLAPLGIAGFAIFLWTWVGTPFASYIAQHDAWQESSTPFAVPKLVGRLFGEFFLGHSEGRLGPGGIDINAANGVLGALVLLLGIYLLWRDRERISLTAFAWTLGVAVLVFTSENTPPNARMLVCAFPALLAIGAHTTGRRRWVVIAVEVVLLVVMTWFTYNGLWLRP